MTANHATSFERPAADDRLARPQHDGVNARHRVKRPKVGIIGYFGCGNLGNEGSLEAMIAFLQRARPDAEIVCICPEPATVHEQHEVATLNITTPITSAAWFDRLNRLLLKLPFRLLNIARTFHQVRDFDYLVVPGTGILDDLGSRPGGMPYALVRWFLCARLAGCKIGLVSIGAGPIINPTNKRLLKLAARLAHYRSYRDAISKQYLSTLGLDTSADPVVADIAFGLEAPVAVRPADEERLTIGVGVMDYHGWFPWAQTAQSTNSTYLDALCLLCTRLLERGYRVRLVVGDDCDRAAVKTVVEKLTAGMGPREGAQLVAEPAASLHDVMRQMADCDVVVATRYHNIVCAMNVSRPVISLGYARKNAVLLEDAGLASFAQHCEQFDVEAILDQVEQQVANRAALAKGVKAACDQYRHRLEEQENWLLDNWI